MTDRPLQSWTDGTVWQWLADRHLALVRKELAGLAACLLADDRPSEAQIDAGFDRTGPIAASPIPDLPPATPTP